MDSKTFLRLKEKAEKALEDALKKDKVDEDIKDLLSFINACEDLFTTSSCSGRVVIIEVPFPGAKPGARFLGKWHGKVDKGKVLRALRSSREGFLFFMVHPPIIHVVARDPEIAEKMVKAGLSSGFKNSGMRAFKGKILVELRSTERLDVPIGKDGELMVSEDYLELLCEIANLMIEKGKRKINILRKNMERFYRNACK
ncbi:MAG TPA: hypothetical protein ENG60_01295 [Thermoplasmatales archaeon]|nr:hypothetical protein [Thermoplasmatales archaeon]HEX17038.1 hypothetical protein [Thermoplasmatales archaeon]